MKLALKLPWAGGSTAIDNKYIPTTTPPFNDPEHFKLGDALSIFGQVALYTGGFLMFFWAVWGVFDYLRAEGNKEGLAKARKKIQWAIVGFVILILAFFMSDIAQTILLNGADIGGNTPTELTKP